MIHTNCRGWGTAQSEVFALQAQSEIEIYILDPGKLMTHL